MVAVVGEGWVNAYRDREPRLKSDVPGGGVAGDGLENGADAGRGRDGA